MYRNRKKLYSIMQSISLNPVVNGKHRSVYAKITLDIELGMNWKELKSGGMAEILIKKFPK